MQPKYPEKSLSGGERARLTLARAFARPSNLLVLDEPTNDLDLETLDLLQERLTEYPGTVLLVSHDRDFLDRVVTSVIATEGDGRWIEYAGGYTDMKSASIPFTWSMVHGPPIPPAAPKTSATHWCSLILSSHRLGPRRCGKRAMPRKARSGAAGLAAITVVRNS